MKTRVLIAGDKPWVMDAYVAWEPPFETALVRAHDELLVKARAWAPQWIAFPHWSRKIPPEIYGAYRTVLFHMTDLPYGRGGTPLQNLILRGHTETKLSAIRVAETLDTGPVYLKRPLSLYGSAGDIYRRMVDLSFQMTTAIVTKNIEPVSQVGEAREPFSRRKPEESELRPGLTPTRLYDHIRMLDAEGYPHAFIPWGKGRIRFTRAKMRGERVAAQAEFVST
jgi:methionyl-tRNA formyltransferase